jgi:hypothetical protein
MSQNLAQFVLQKKKRKEKRGKQQLSLGQTSSLLVPAHASLPQLFFAIKSCFIGQFLNFMCILCIGSNLVG